MEISYTTSTLFEDSLKVYNLLSKDEQKFVCNGMFIDSKYSKYRKNYLVNFPVSFIECYELPKNKSELFIVIAIIKEYRRIGLSNVMVKDMIEFCKKVGYKNLVWRTDITNKSSNSLAISHGFIKKRSTYKNKNTYVLTV